MHVCLIRHMHDIFLHYKNNLSDISRITYALLSSSKLHGSATADNLIRGIDRRMHAKTLNIFETLSTVHESGGIQLQLRYYSNERQLSGNDVCLLALLSITPVADTDFCSK